MVILEILGYAVIAIFIVILFIVLSILTQYLSLFCWRKCKDCGHTMEYKGKREKETKGCYLFHCPKCGKWEKIPCDAISSNS